MSKLVTVTGSSAYNTVSFTLSSNVDSLKITGSSFNIDSLLPTAATITVSGYFFAGSAYPSVGFSKNERNYSYGSLSDTSWTNSSPTRAMSLAVQGSSSTSTSNVFNSQNPTEREVTVYYNGGSSRSLYFTALSSGGNSSVVQIYDTFTLGQKLILDAPPTFTAPTISFDTPYVYSGLTTASVTVSDASAKYGGNISSIAFTIGNQTVTRSDNGTLSILLDTGGVFTPTVTVTDSRGQTTTKTLDPITVNVYTAPSISFDVARTLNDGTPDDEGTYGLIEAELTFSDVVATAVAPSVVLTDDDGLQTTPTVTWYTDDTLATPVTWANVSSGDTVYGLFSGLSTQHSYQVSVRPRDSEGTGTAVTQTIAPAFYTVDFLAGGHGIAFGKPASDVGFFCNMDAHFVDANSVMRALFDFVYPVGSYYETSDTAFDPNTTWGGTWVLETAGQVHISAGTSTTSTVFTVNGANANSGVGMSDGGEEKHWLTMDEMPTHNHGYYYTNSGAGVKSLAWWSASGNGLSYDLVNTGGNQTHNNMQPYIVVNRWHRTA